MHNLYTLSDIFTNGYNSSLLNIISLLAILCGISVIITKNPIVSVLYLIGLFFSIASYLMSLGLNFIGLSYLLVYVGAVSILFLFILMLINVRISELVTDNSNSIVLAIIIGLFIVTPIYAKGSYNNIVNILHYGLSNNTTTQGIFPYFNLDVSIEKETMGNGPWSLLKDFTGSINSMFSNIIDYDDRKIDSIYFVTSKTWDGVLGEMSHITAIGNIMYTSYPLWLILTSVILLLAMVGAIVITIKQ